MFLEIFKFFEDEWGVVLLNPKLVIKYKLQLLPQQSLRYFIPVKR